MAKPGGMDLTSVEAIEAAIDFCVASLIEAGAELDAIALVLHTKALELKSGQIKGPGKAN